MAFDLKREISDFIGPNQFNAFNFSTVIGAVKGKKMVIQKKVDGSFSVRFGEKNMEP